MRLEDSLIINISRRDIDNTRKKDKSKANILLGMIRHAPPQPDFLEVSFCRMKDEARLAIRQNEIFIFLQRKSMEISLWEEECSFSSLSKVLICSSWSSITKGMWGYSDKLFLFKFRSRFINQVLLRGIYIINWFLKWPIQLTLHYEKYRNFTWFSSVEILRKGTVSA